MARTWTLPPDPAGEGVTELWDRDGHRWYVSSRWKTGTGCWRSESVGDTGWGWLDLLHQMGPMADEPPGGSGGDRPRVRLDLGPDAPGQCGSALLDVVNLEADPVRCTLTDGHDDPHQAPVGDRTARWVDAETPDWAWSSGGVG